MPGLLALLVAGCPGGGEATGEVRAGQRWRFRSAGVGEQVYEVTAVTAAEVVFRVRTSAGGEPLGDPLEQRFARGPAPPALVGGEPGPPLALGGLRLETWITREGRHTTTTAVQGRAPVFPGVVRVERDGAVLLELLDVR